MRFRRLCTLLTSVTMLHLSVVAGDTACVTHGTNGPDAAMADHATPMAGHVMSAGADSRAASAVPAAQPDTPPCETPVQQHCCEAVAGCGVVGAVTGVERTLASAVLAQARIHEALHDAPTSFAPAPEPPPPKA